MTHLHTYEFECQCGSKMTAEKYTKFDTNPPCILCGESMEIILYMRTPDTRAGGTDE